MKREAGLWIDHRQAVIVIFTDKGQEIKSITSNVRQHIRYAGGSQSRTSDWVKKARPADQQDEHLAKHANQYYDEIIAFIREAESIQIFGPGEAKDELAKRLAFEGLKERIVALETVDKMTDHQLAAKVRERFLA